MNWYWIVLLVITYFIMWLIVAAVFSRLTEVEPAESAVFGIVWPLVIVAIVFVGPFYLMQVAVEKLVEKYGRKDETPPMTAHK